MSPKVKAKLSYKFKLSNKSYHFPIKVTLKNNNTFLKNDFQAQSLLFFAVCCQFNCRIYTVFIIKSTRVTELGDRSSLNMAMPDFGKCIVPKDPVQSAHFVSEIWPFIIAFLVDQYLKLCLILDLRQISVPAKQALVVHGAGYRC